MLSCSRHRPPRPAAYAVSLSELSDEVDRAVAGQLGEQEEQALFGNLADVSVEVANRYDTWVGPNGPGLRRRDPRRSSLADALLPLLERLYNFHQGRIDRAQNDIIAQDGNPEVLYEQRVVAARSRLLARGGRALVVAPLPAGHAPSRRQGAAHAVAEEERQGVLRVRLRAGPEAERRKPARPRDGRKGAR